MHYAQYCIICNIDAFSNRNLILECADWLACEEVPDARRKLFRMVEERPYLKRSSKGLLRIDLRRTRRELAAAIWRLRKVRALVDSNPAVVGGEPTFRGTRIPTHLVASLLLEGAPEEQLKESYPRLTRQMIRLAPLYAAAYPLPWSKCF